jgi:hypothetical protein
MSDIPPQPDGTEPVKIEFHDPFYVCNPVSATHCRRGHRYIHGGGQNRLYFVGCGCDTARYGGHRVYKCLIDGYGQPCGDERWLPVCSDPSLHTADRSLDQSLVKEEALGILRDRGISGLY